MAEPLNVLLWASLSDLEREFEAAARDPSLGVSLELHETVLRHIGDDGLDLGELPRLARVSKRAAHYAVELANRRRWVSVEPGSRGRGQRAYLTAEGRIARDESDRCVRAAEEAMRARSGDGVVASLRESLAAIVSRFDLELPHHPTGYGPADSSVAGGVANRWGRPHARRSKGMPGFEFDPVEEHRRAEAWEQESGGRLYVGAHGQDWKPVQRGEGDTVAGLPLHALLSQASMALAIDYEGSGGFPLNATASVVREIGDEGVQITLRPSRSRKPSSSATSSLLPTDYTFAALERHAYAVIEPDPTDGRKGRLRLTDKGRAVRDSYDKVLSAVEQRWERRYGAATVRALRKSLEVFREGEVRG